MVKGGAKSSHGQYSTIITFYIDCATMVVAVREEGPGGGRNECDVQQAT